MSKDFIVEAQEKGYMSLEDLKQLWEKYQSALNPA